MLRRVKERGGERKEWDEKGGWGYAVASITEHQIAHLCM